MNKALVYTFFLLIVGSMTTSYSASRNNASHIHKTQKPIDRMDTGKKITRKESEEGLDRTTKEVLLNFGNIVTNFFALLQNPNNPNHVGNCVQGMLCSMVNIGVAATKSKPISEETADTLELAHKIQDSICRMITHRAKSIRHES